MKKVLIVGNSPLPNENSKSRPAAGLRTFQFLKPFMTDGFEVELVSIAMPECYEELPKSGGQNHLVSKNDPNLRSKIQKIHDEFSPDVIVSVNTHPSYIVSGIKSDAPLWADLNGWIMAEGQAQAYKKESNDYLPHYWEMEKTVLERADKFSTVSEKQKYALIGELAGMGRLNRESFGYEFVTAIANGTEWFEGEREYKEAPELFEGIPADACVALWLGGYNTWVDEESLFKAVEGAMEECEKLYFVSTGGKVKGLDNRTFLRFREMVDGSIYKERFIFLGWVETEDIPYIYERADFGLNVDRMCIETETGARNRINEMMKFSLPVVTTKGSEISYEVELVGAGLAAPSEDYESLKRAIVRMYGEWTEDGLEEYRVAGASYIEEECNYEVLNFTVVEWAKNARRAPDAGIGVNLSKGRGVGMAFRYLKENGFKKFFKKVLQYLH